MDLNPNLVQLPNIWIEKSWDFAEQAVADYAAGKNQNSAKYTCFDADKKTELWAVAKMAECAFAIFVGIDPEALHWSRKPDDGHDLHWRGKFWDVKNTAIHNRYLIWPYPKTGIFHSKRFDALVLVKHFWPQFIIQGWVEKSRFFAEKRVAKTGDKLFPGTWYMEECELNSFQELAAAA